MSFFTRQEVEQTKKPLFTGHRWMGFSDSQRRVLLSRTKCNEVGRPVQKDERPVAYRHSIHGKGKRKYIPLFDRTYANIDTNQLHRKDIYPFQPRKRKTIVSLVDLVSIENGLIIETFNRSTYKKSGLNVVDLSSNNILPLSQVYYRIRNVRDNNGTIIAKRKNDRQELILIKAR